MMTVEKVMPLFKRLGVDVKKSDDGILIQSEEGVIHFNENYRMRLKRGETLWQD